MPAGRGWRRREAGGGVFMRKPGVRAELSKCRSWASREREESRKCGVCGARNASSAGGSVGELRRNWRSALLSPCGGEVILQGTWVADEAGRAFPGAEIAADAAGHAGHDFAEVEVAGVGLAQAVAAGVFAIFPGEVGTQGEVIFVPAAAFAEAGVDQPQAFAGAAGVEPVLREAADLANFAGGGGSGRLDEPAAGGGERLGGLLRYYPRDAA